MSPLRPPMATIPCATRHTPRLAQELVDFIIDNLDGDIQALSTCSLISRSWSFRPSAYLCRRIRVTAESFDMFIQTLKTSCRLCLFVHEVVLQGGVGTMGQSGADGQIHDKSLQIALAKLPHLRELELRDVSITVDIPKHPEADAITTFRPSISTLRIVGQFSPRPLCALLRGFHSISELVFYGAHSTGGSPSQSTCEPILPTSIDSISSFKTEPRCLSLVIKELPSSVISDVYHLTLDDGTFASTLLARQFNQLLREAGSSIGVLDFRIPFVKSIAAQGECQRRRWKRTAG